MAPLALSVLLLGAAWTSPAEASVSPTTTVEHHDSVRTDVVEVKRKLRVPELTPAAVWIFMKFGAGLAFEVVRDNPWTFVLVTAGGVALGVVGCASLCGAAGGAVAAALYLTGTLVTWPLAFVVLGPAAAGALSGVAPGLLAGSVAGLLASIDEGELSSPLGASSHPPAGSSPRVGSSMPY